MPKVTFLMLKSSPEPHFNRYLLNYTLIIMLTSVIHLIEKEVCVEEGTQGRYIFSHEVQRALVKGKLGSFLELVYS